MEFRPWLLLVIFVAFSPADAADERSQYDAAYAEYGQHVQSGDWRAALGAAEKSWRIGKGVFGEDSINTANLAINHARLLNRFRRGEEAAAVLVPALDVYRDQYGKDGSELVDVYMELGKATRDSTRQSRRYFKRAFNLIPEEDVMLRAKVYMEAGTTLEQTTFGRTLVKRAYETYSEHVGKIDIRTAMAAFNLARYEMADSDYKDARALLDEAIAVFSKPGANARQFEMTARAFMVKTLEGLGESDEATKHCRVIGQKSPPGPDDEYLPVYKQMPEYPFPALRRGQSGWVVVEFTVDDAGFTRDHRVVESSNRIFEDAALTAAQAFRYAPRFRDGKPVVTNGVQNKMTFDILN